MNDQSDTTSSRDVSGQGNKQLPWHAWLTLALTIAVVAFTVFVFDTKHCSSATKADVSMALPFLQVLGGVIVFLTVGLPKSKFEWAVVVALQVLMRMNVEVLDRDMHKTALLNGAQLTVRVFVIGLWLLMAAGLVALIVTVFRRSVRWYGGAPRMMKIGLAAAIVLLPLELVSALVEARRNAPLPIPSNLPRTDEIHIATVGGSTMLGYPYNPHYGTGRVAVWHLQQAFPDRSFRLDNVAVTGMNLDMAVSQLAEAEAFPDIVVVYSGHNEFFHNVEEFGLLRRTHWPVMDGVMRHSPLFRLLHLELSQHCFSLAPVQLTSSLCSIRLCPDYVIEERLIRYRNRLTQLFGWARDHKVGLVFCVPAASEKDLEPNMSMVSDSFTQSPEVVDTQWEEIRQLQAEGKWGRAAEECRSGLESNPDFAEFHFRLGECLHHMGHHEEALTHFRRARDIDQFPLRCRSRFRDTGIAAAIAFHVPIVDSEECLRAYTQDGILGEETFLDGVHPNLRATFTLGRQVARSIIAEQLAGLSDPLDINATFQSSLSDLGVTPEVLTKAYRITATVIEGYAEFRPYDNTRRLAEAAAWRERSEALESGEIKPGEGGTESLHPDDVSPRTLSPPSGEAPDTTP